VVLASKVHPIPLKFLFGEEVSSSSKKKMTEQDKHLERWSTFNLLSTENYRNYSNHNFLGWIPDLNTITS